MRHFASLFYAFVFGSHRARAPSCPSTMLPIAIYFHGCWKLIYQIPEFILNSVFGKFCKYFPSNPSLGGQATVASPLAKNPASRAPKSDILKKPIFHSFFICFQQKLFCLRCLSLVDHNKKFSNPSNYFSSLQSMPKSGLIIVHREYS